MPPSAPADKRGLGLPESGVRFPLARQCDGAIPYDECTTRLS
jgi:hypothetical protein